ncbi:MAG: hemerythrin domain-containing protein [Chloroflexi bacterium]|uniref:Hemerythrin domain-containing protein n=1 Tax=Candidatus Chlorohelix allophototropha TaxID=3003348 RepID=A0A8T7LUB5_9CHLR|nr:hemerythrin domain-containing protein [Chloroflexota bacterium]WJW66328.1 hemerythrin domain-containing protein [Chloroflexota bacterium L227-S17]
MLLNSINKGVATGVLREEHEAILKVMGFFDKALDRLEATKPVPLDFLEGIVEFFSLFADRCHHTKEEEVLFPMMESFGIPRENGPIGVMLNEHTLGRDYVRQIGEGVARLQSGDNSGNALLITAGTSYSRLLREHILKENQVLFMLADNVLDATIQAKALAQFEKLEVEKMGEGTHERLHARIDIMEQQASNW